MTLPDRQLPDRQQGSAVGRGAAHTAVMSDERTRVMWDEMYADRAAVWSGEPNHALTVEAGGLRPGRALDVGCGEGADAVWLAWRGWDVVGVDPSGVALDRARAAAHDAGVSVTWRHGTLAGADLPEGGFDLVSACYAVLEKQTRPVERLTSLVAPGGTLLVVHHDLSAAPDHDGHGHAHAGAAHDAEGAAGAGEVDPRFDPDALLLPADVVVLLGDDWQVLGPERRDRVVSGGSGAHHVADLVVRATRR